MAVYETRLIACPMCQAVTPHEVRKTNHGLHLVLTLMTFGLWLSIWLIAIVLGNPKQCQQCVARLHQQAMQAQLGQQLGRLDGRR